MNLYKHKQSYLISLTDISTLVWFLSVVISIYDWRAIKIII